MFVFVVREFYIVSFICDFMKYINIMEDCVMDICIQLADHNIIIIITIMDRIEKKRGSVMF